MSSQRERVLLHLKRKQIDPMTALRRYGCLRLAARIDELRNQGYEIVSRLVERGGKRFAQYRLIRERSNSRA